MEKRRLEVAVSEAGTELTAAINAIQSKYGLHACLMEGLVSGSLAEIRKGVLHELSIAYQAQQQEREKALVEQFEKGDAKPASEAVSSDGREV